MSSFCSLAFASSYGVAPLRTGLRGTFCGSRAPGVQKHSGPVRTTRRRARLVSCTSTGGELVAIVRDDAKEAEELLLKFWRLTDEGRFLQLVELFTEDALYYDTLYPGPFTGKKGIEEHMAKMEDAIPADMLRFVLDDIAPSANKVGARWHLETKSGANLPFSRGCSMYTLVRADDGRLLISEAWDFLETPIKAAGSVFPLLRGLSLLFKTFGNKKE